MSLDSADQVSVQSLINEVDFEQDEDSDGELLQVKSRLSFIDASKSFR